MPADRDEQRLKRITQAGRFRRTDLCLRGRAILVDTARLALVWADTTYPLQPEECAALHRQCGDEEATWDITGPHLTPIEARLLERVRWWERHGEPCSETYKQLAAVLECSTGSAFNAVMSLCARGILTRRREHSGHGPGGRRYLEETK